MLATACNAVSVRWVPHEEGRKKCCSIFSDQSNELFDTYGYCTNICGLCCKKAIVTLGDCEGQEPEGPTPADDPGDFPTITPTDTGVSFTQSAFGAPLPIVFGADRLTGNVFWASSVRTVLFNNDTSYYNTVDFAIGFCEGEINGILRMWLGEKLILDRTAKVDGLGIAQPGQSGVIAGASIDLTDSDGPLRNLNATSRQTKVTVYVGSETQLPDPRHVAYEGYENSPAYRGLAYIMFENFIISETNIPNIFVELTSNTTTSFPRLFVLDVTPEEFFDRPTGEFLLVDPSYNLLHVGFEDSNGTATPPNGDGVRTFDYNTMAYINSKELRVSNPMAADFTLTRLLPYSGNIIFHEPASNAGILHVYNPLSQTVLDSFGPGGGVSDHNINTGLSRLFKGSIAFQGLSPTKLGLIDIFMGVGNTNQAIGFVEIDQNGQMEFVRNLGPVMSEQDARSCHFSHSGSVAALNPKFFDNVSAVGGWVYMIVQDTNGTDTEFKVARIKVADENYNSLLLTTTYQEFATIPVNNLRGEGIVHNCSAIFVDPSDGTLVVFCTISSTTDDSIVFKWSPFTNEVVWLTTAPEYEQTNGGDFSTLSNSVYAWVNTGAGSIYRLDAKEGTVEQVEDLISSQDLPVPTSFTQFWNSTENSITYLSTTANERVVKVFIDKLQRATVDLGDIVESLLARVGLLGTDLDISDVTALTLTGYTISKKQSLRTCFSELAQAFKFDVVESNGRIKYQTRGGAAATTINHKYFGDTDENGWLAARDENDISRIRKISLKYRDVDRDYKDNVQTIILPKTDNFAFDTVSSIDVDVPVVLDAATAKSLAEILLYAKLVYDTTYEAELPPRFLDLDPGDVVTVEPDSNPVNNFQMRIRRTQVGANKAINVEASREDPDIYNDVVNLFGDTGRYIESVFKPIPPRIDAQILEIPYRSETEGQEDLSSYYMYVTFLNLRPNAAMEQDPVVKLNAVDEYTIPKIDAFPTWGYVITPPTSSSSIYATDNVSQLRVKIMNETGAVIASATSADLLASDQCNLCYIEGELIQFTTAVDEGNDVWLFTGLHRAKLGTITGYGQARPGSRFILLAGNDSIFDDASVRRLQYRTGNPATIAQFFFKTGNPYQSNSLHSFSALNLQPWTVADFQAAYSGTDAVISWQRRTRFNGELPDDGSETTPVNEAVESYVLYLFVNDATFDTSDASTYLRKVQQGSNTFTYTAAMQTEDSFDRLSQDLYVAVYQAGSVEGFATGATRKRVIAHL